MIDKEYLRYQVRVPGTSQPQVPFGSGSGSGSGSANSLVVLGVAEVAGVSRVAGVAGVAGVARVAGSGV
jgi:hypothetical protein